MSNKNEDSDVFSLDAIINAIAEFNSKKEIIIASDASSYRRAWIMHKLENCLIKPIVQVFRTLL